MKHYNHHTGFAIAIAWPETFCKQPGAWYDMFTTWLGINKNNYYRVGHAALVLINSKNKNAHYFDFGRYHTPFQHGRIRSYDTDHDLLVNTVPVINEKENRIENFYNIVNELRNNPSCHGDGILYASYCSISFEKAFEAVKNMQNRQLIPYQNKRKQLFPFC